LAGRGVLPVATRGVVDASPPFDEKTGVFTISVEATFRATHHVRLPDGSVERPHPHTWRVCVFLRRHELDRFDMVADFEHVQEALRSVVLPLEQTDLNRFSGFAGRNPTAEVVAEYFMLRLVEAGLSHLHRVEVTEAPGCVAGFERG
jgi:6-pyruvoyl-tetrahydropterin synthase